MASFSLCYYKANLQSKALTPLNQAPPLTSPAQAVLLSKHTHFKHNPTRFNKLQLNYIHPKHTHIFNHLDESMEPSLSTAEESPLKIGIIGLGNFGQFIAKGLKRQGHHVLATSRSDYSGYCHQHGINYFRDVDAMCSEQPDIVLVCSSILSTESVVRKIPMHELKQDTIFADVLSVKQFPRNLFLEVLPPNFGIVCTHPMFGPESGKHGWNGLPFVYDKVRISSTQSRKCAQFLSIFENEGCRMVEMSCAEHDRHAAGSQFITHTIGRILSHLDLESTPINTKGYETLLQLVNEDHFQFMYLYESFPTYIIIIGMCIYILPQTANTVSDSFDLYYGLFMYNGNTTEQIENLDRAFETVKQKLFGRLHDILRKQIEERAPMQALQYMTKEVRPTPYIWPSSKKMKDLTSFAMPQSHDNNAAALPLTIKTRIPGL